MPPPHGAAGTGALPLPSPAALPSQQRPGPWSPGSSLPAAVVGKAAAAAADGDEDEWDEGFQEEQEDPKTAQHEEEEEEEEEEGEEEEENVSPPKKPSSSSRPASAASAASSSAGDLTCAICLDAIPLEDLATVPGCEHAYCAACIVGWAVASSPADASGSDVCGKCPQCKREYASVATHRRLDGTLSDYPVEESVCLLRRARWFCAGAGAAVAAAAAAAAARPRSPPMAPSDIDQADRIHANGGGIGGSGSGRTYSRRQHYYDDDDDDLDDGENDGPGNARSVKTIPDWARGKNLRDALEAQAHVDPDVIFGARRTTVPLDELFGHPDRLRTGGGTGGGGAAAAAAAARYDESRRGSSGNWADDGATWAEELAYKRAMGYPVPGAGGAPVSGAMGPPPPPLGQQQQQQQQPSFLSRRG